MTSQPPITSTTDEPTLESHVAPGLPGHPEFEPVVPVKKHRRVVVLLAVLLALALVIGVGFGGYRYYLTHHAKPAAAQGSQTPASNAPPVENTAFGNVNAAYVTFPLTKDQTTVDPVAGTGTVIATANGHYLLRDTQGFTYGPSGNKGGKLLYDGRVIYDGLLLWQFALSLNGEHYAYQLDTSPDNRSPGNDEIFVDGKLVQTIPDSHGVYYLQVSNDGQHYAYATGSGQTSGDPYLVKDGKTIYTSTKSIGTLSFDGNLEHYILQAMPISSTSEKYDVALDGRSLQTDMHFTESVDRYVAISADGQHYIYANGSTLYMDGKEVQKDVSPIAAAVTDGGNYGLVNTTANKVVTSQATFTMSNEFAQCSPGCGGNYPEFALSNDGLHYAFGTQQPNLWNIDGATVTPAGNIEGVEFVGSTLYLYRWAPDPYTGWQTYTNSQVTLKYPSSWMVMPGHYGEVDAKSPTFNTTTMATDEKPGAPVIEFLRLYTDSSTVGCQDAPCQVSAVIPLNNPQLPGAVFAIVNQTSSNGTHFTQWVVASGNTKVGATSITGVTAGTGGMYVFGQSVYYPTNPSLGLAARVTNVPGFESDSHFKDLITLINSITFK